MDVSSSPAPEAFTVAEVARRYGTNATKIIGWIHAGELRAVNIALRTSNRPRWRILAADLAAFEESRAARPAQGGADAR